MKMMFDKNTETQIIVKISTRTLLIKLKKYNEKRKNNFDNYDDVIIRLLDKNGD